MRESLLILLFCCGSTSAFAETRKVGAGDDLQAVLNAARAGDEIRLAAGATFTGNFVLPAFEGTTPVTIRTDIADAALPASNERVTPAIAAGFAKIVSPNNSAAIRTAPGAHDWTLLFVEVPNTRGGYGDIIQLGDGTSAQSRLSEVPRDLVVDRVYIHGDPMLGQKRGIALNSGATTIRNSYISEIKAAGADAQAIGGWNGPGPYTIENNYLEAAGEVFLLGGADPSIKDLVPSDIVVRGNHMTRPLTWKGSKWQIKNIFELKNARRVRVEYNLFENNWQAAQPGYAILFTPRNQEGGCAWCVVEDVAFARNIVRNVSAGVNILGHDSPNPSRQTNGIRITDNLFTGVTTSLGGNGWGVLIGDGPRDIVIDRNTFDSDGSTVVYAYGAPVAGFQFTNNAARHGEYGINGADASPGTAALDKFFPGAVVTGNLLSGGSAGKYPAGNRFDARFDPSSRGAGADVVKLRALLESVPRGRPTSSAK